MRIILLRRGQGLADLALIIVVAGLVFMGMQAYVKRGVQGKVKDLTDYIVSSNQSAGDDAVAQTTSFTVNSTMTSTESQGGSSGLLGTEKSTSTWNIPFH